MIKSTTIDHIEDRISELPDDILVECLSLLEMKNAAQTSILSKRWRYLSTYLTCLDFDADVMYPEQAATYWKNHGYEISRYFGWVNQVVCMHQSPSIDKFRVYSTFVSGYGTQLNKWVKFAFSKQVKELVLNLDGIQMKRTDCPKEGFPLGLDILSHPPCLSGIRALRSLHLCYVNVSQEFIEFVLSHCLHLERLYLHSAPLLSNLKVKTSKLKYFTIITSFCDFNLLEIDAENLLYFEYQDKRRESSGPCMVFKTLPMLVETCFHGGLCVYPFPIFHTLSLFCNQLCKLSLRIEHDYCEELVIPDGVVPIFTQLKHFTCTIDCRDYTCILSMKRFIEACPMLEEFKLQVAFMGGRQRKFEEANELQGIVLEDEHENGEATNSEISQFREAKVENMNEEKQTHKNLKTLEIVGFLGASCDVQLALAIVSYASSLETIICDPQALRYSGTPYGFFNDSWREYDVAKSKRRALKLSKIVAPMVKVVII
ncbi:putative F-box/FBD/LRR-repeat protein At4g00315 isoform X2 [Silene latifolia]|uniref:putative F-box/FBD/LRR-repeat protein At4g00315 isoform X2 n=1 Tax=Silene latifolia TaxID=37657 RepID=UPI003D785EC1